MPPHYQSAATHPKLLSLPFTAAVLFFLAWLPAVRDPGAGPWEDMNILDGLLEHPQHQMTLDIVTGVRRVTIEHRFEGSPEVVPVAHSASGPRCGTYITSGDPLTTSKSRPRSA